MLLSFSRSGTTREEVEGEYGNSGLRKLEELLKKGILSESEGAIYGMKEKERVTFDQETLVDVFANCTLDSYIPEDFGTGKNWLSFQTNSIDEKKAFKLIHSKLQKTFKEIDEILSLPDYHGKDKVFVGMVADFLLQRTK